MELKDGHVNCVGDAVAYWKNEFHSLMPCIKECYWFLTAVWNDPLYCELPTFGVTVGHANYSAPYCIVLI